MGSKINIVDDHTISVVQEPEVAASSGVVPTPKLIVRNIVNETFNPLFSGKSLQQIQQLKIADICCGSGTFLISAYDYFLEKIILSLVHMGGDNSQVIYKTFDGSYHLTMQSKTPDSNR